MSEGVLAKMMEDGRMKAEAIRSGESFRSSPTLFRYKMQTAYGILSVDATFQDGEYQSSTVTHQK